MNPCPGFTFFLGGELGQRWTTAPRPKWAGTSRNMFTLVENLKMYQTVRRKTLFSFTQPSSRGILFERRYLYINETQFLHNPNPDFTKPKPIVFFFCQGCGWVQPEPKCLKSLFPVPRCPKFVHRVRGRDSVRDLRDSLFHFSLPLCRRAICVSLSK